MRRPWVLTGTAASAAVLLTTLLTPGPVVVRASVVDRAAVVADEAYWVSTAQLTCAGDGTGAIAEARIAGPGPVSVHPYEANIGARALVAAGGRYLPMVRDWVRWYLGHLNQPDLHGVTGTVYDFTYDPVTCRGEFQPDPVTGAVPSYDSTDAYAGTFLSLVAAWARVDPTATDLIGTPAAREGLERVADAILATRAASGLTSATPGYPAEYLLDNVEAQQGLADYGRLLSEVLGDPGARQRRDAEADAVRAAIEDVLWRGSLTPGMYAVAADEPAPDRERWYPDSIAQLWPVWDLLGPDARRASAWAAFTARWPGWTDSTPAYGSVSVGHDPNAAVAYAAALAGDGASLDAYLAASQRNWADAGRPPPWTVDDSGFRALAASVGPPAEPPGPAP